MTKSKKRPVPFKKPIAVFSGSALAQLAKSENEEKLDLLTAILERESRLLDLLEIYECTEGQTAEQLWKNLATKLAEVLYPGLNIVSVQRKIGRKEAWTREDHIFLLNMYLGLQEKHPSLTKEQIFDLMSEQKFGGRSFSPRSLQNEMTRARKRTFGFLGVSFNSERRRYESQQ